MRRQWITRPAWARARYVAAGWRCAGVTNIIPCDPHTGSRLSYTFHGQPVPSLPVVILWRPVADWNAAEAA